MFHFVYRLKLLKRFLQLLTLLNMSFSFLRLFYSIGIVIGRLLLPKTWLYCFTDASVKSPEANRATEVGISL
jgi:hypothetical protein